MASPVALSRHVECFISDRFGGVSDPPYDELNLGDHVGDDLAAVEQNRTRLAARLRLRRGQLIFMRQVHGRDVVVVGAPRADVAPGADPGSEPAAAGPHEVRVADAMVTTRADLALVVLVADCAPVVLAADDPPMVAVAHAGRRGLTAGVVVATVRAMSDLGGDPAHIRAVVGPGICGRCYEVPETVQAEVSAEVPTARATSIAGTPAIDIRAGVIAQLRAAGVRSVEADRRCTYESPELFSHRRSGRTGRFAAVGWLRS